MNRLGLIGKKLGHSFSKNYFEQKFEKLSIPNYSYSLFELESINDFPQLIKKTDGLKGLNVTIPYKESVIPFLDEITPEAKRIGAVNTIKIINRRLIGYNTDFYGFESTLLKWVPKLKIKKALVLGNGGASKAVKEALSLNNIHFSTVSRSPSPQTKSIGYEEINHHIIENHNLIINTTPLGMSPQNDTFPPIPYDLITPGHYLYDLVYNPKLTQFMQKGVTQNAQVKNGLDMLYAQADKAWEIWNS